MSPKKLTQNLLIDASNIYSKSINDYYLLLSQQRLSLQKQMRTGVQIDHFINDSIKFNLGLLKVKKVPVKVATDITYSSGYELNGVLQVSPDSITINGPESILDTIHFVSTTLLQKKGINNSIDQELMIKNFAASSNVKLNQEKVTVKALVEKYTEGTFEVPFEIVNLPEGMTINTLKIDYIINK